MRVLVPALLAALAIAPSAVAPSTGCYAIPPGYYAGTDWCTVSFTSGPGTILVTIEAIVGSVGEVVIHGDGPGYGDIVASCTLRYNAGTCAGPLSLFLPTAGTWSFTAYATNANVNGDSRVWFSVSYP